MGVEQQKSFRAVAHPTRRAIIDLLARHEMNAGAVADHFTISRPAVAKHLRILRDGGFVGVRRRGRERIHRLRAEGLRALADWVGHYEQFWNQRLAVLKREVEENK